MDILGLHNIPTSAQLTAAGVVMEDHAAAQALAIIDHAKTEILAPLLAAIEDLKQTVVSHVGPRIDAATATITRAVSLAESVQGLAVHIIKQEVPVGTTTATKYPA